MKTKDFNKLKDEFYQKSVVINTYDNQIITGNFNFIIDNFEIIYVGNEEIYIKDIKNISLKKDNKIYKYVAVSYEDDDFDEEYSYKTTLSNIRIGDIVLVDR